jgi:hypothetical protein
MRFGYDDGGRGAAGFKGSAGDCVARAVAIASGRPYAEVYATLCRGAGAERKSRGASARNGIRTKRKWFKDQMRAMGFAWTPTMLIGSGCKAHLTDGELPAGRLVVAVSRHYTAVIDGVIHDTHDPQREETWHYPQPDGTTITTVNRRCVYGYWRLA